MIYSVFILSAYGMFSYWIEKAHQANCLSENTVLEIDETSLKVHRFGIVNYSETNLNNGILEGINSKIQLAKKRERGFRNGYNLLI